MVSFGSDTRRMLETAYNAGAKSAEAECGEVRYKLEEAQSALLKIHDHAQRASLVQDRSIGIIKQVCASISADAKNAALKAQ